MKLYFHPGTDMAQAMAETIDYVNRSRAFMPPGTVSPFVMRFDTGSVPVGYLVLSSETEVDRRDSGPGAVQGPADVRQPAGRLGAAAVRRQPAHRRRPRRSRPAAVLQHVARRGRHGARPRATRSAPRATSASATSMPIVPINSLVKRRQGAGERSRSAPGTTRPSTSATSATVAGRHRHPHRLRPGQRPPGRLHPGHQAGRRLDAVGRQRRQGRPCPRCRRSCPTTSTSASSSTSRRTSPRRCGALATEGAARARA